MDSKKPDRAARRGEEHELVNKFRSNPSPETFSPLYKTFKNLIFNAAKPNMYGSTIPQSAHMSYAAQSFLDAARTWDPKKGSFSTHAFSTVTHKGKRLNLTYQNIGYIPESRGTKYQLFNNTVALLKEQLGRDPSTSELADELAWSVRDVEAMNKEVRKSYVLDEHVSESFSLSRSNQATQIARDILYQLIPEHQLVLEHLVGLNGKAIYTKTGGGTDLPALSKVTGLSVPKIRSALKTITRKFKSYKL